MSLNDVCTCCGGYENQPILQLFEDKCFKVYDGTKLNGEFCLADFAFPVDGHTCTGLNVNVSDELVIFDNALDPLGVDPLESGKLYARGVIIKIVYPTNDVDGDELEYVQKSVKLVMQNSTTFAETEYPLSDLFMIFTNAKSNRREDLINKIKVVNPNSNYAIRVMALVIFGEAA